MKKIIFISILILMSNLSKGQDLGLHFMNNVYQSTYTNPAKMNKHRINVTLPALNINFAHTGPTIGSMLMQDVDGNYYIDTNSGISKLKDNNYIRLDGAIETIGAGLRFGKYQVGFSHSLRTFNSFKYTKQLAEVIFNGNAQYVGETVNVAPALNVSVYSEFKLNGAYQINDQLSVGLGIKYLSGIGNVSTSKDELSIYTDPEYYQITATTDYEVNSAGEGFALDIYNDGDSVNVQFNDYFSEVNGGNLLFGRNTGIAFDLGAVYQLGKIRIEAALTDIGSINWKSNARNFTSQGTYTFDGIDGNPILFEEDSFDFSEVLDTLVDVLGFQSTENTYKTSLNSQYYLSGSYQIKDGLDVGVLLQGALVAEKFRPAIALSCQKRFGNIFSLGAVYSMRNKSFTNLGLNFVLKLGPIQLYGASDNMLSVFLPYNSKNTHFRMGMNVALGKKKEKEAIIDLE